MMINPVALQKALLMMGIALPVMFIVIGVFIGLIYVLHKSFPAPQEEECGDEDGLE